MSKKLVKLGAASLVAVGAGAAVIAKNKKNAEKEALKEKRAKELEAYRNTACK